MGSGNHVFDGGSDPPMRRDNFEGGKGRLIVKYMNSTVICAKTDEPIEMPFGSDEPKEACVRGPGPPWEGVILRGKRAARCKQQSIATLCHDLCKNG